MEVVGEEGGAEGTSGFPADDPFWRGGSELLTQVQSWKWSGGRDARLGL